MSCTACAAAVEAALLKCQGVEQVNVSYALEEARIQVNTPEAIPLALAAVTKAGYSALPLDSPDLKSRNPVQVSWALTFALPVFVSGMFFHEHPFTPYLGFFFSSLILWLGQGFFARGFMQLRQGHPGMDSLVAISTGISYSFSTIALLLGQTHVLFFEAAAMVLSFVMLGKWLEERARDQSLSGFKSLLDLMPKQARVHPSGNWVPVTSVKTGTLIEVALGDEMPVDGLLESGSLELDTSWLSGESVPALVIPANPVYAGSVVLNGNGVVRVQAVGDSSRLGITLAQVKRAMASNPPIQRIADALASKFVLFIFALALLSAAIWLVLAPFSPGLFALQVGLTVLAVACPCALGLAVPTAISVSLAKAAKRSIFFQKPEALESLAKVNQVFLDKTGTLTQGKPKVVWASSQNETIQFQVAKLAGKSQHPLSKSLAAWAGSAALSNEEMEANPVSEFPGLGLEWIADTGVLRLGAPNWAGPWPQGAPKEGSQVVLGDGTQTFAAFLLQDAIRLGLENTLSELRVLGIRPVVLSGDHSLSSELRSLLEPDTKVFLHQSPEEKAQMVVQSQLEGNTVLMVGDGINDAPALAQANVAIAMGEGAYLARHCSHISLGNSNLLLLPESIRLARHTQKIMRQNLVWALSYNAVVLPLAAGIMFPFTGQLFNPMWAGIAMALSSILVVLNSLRLSFS